MISYFLFYFGIKMQKFDNRITTILYTLWIMAIYLVTLCNDNGVVFVYSDKMRSFQDLVSKKCPTRTSHISKNCIFHSNIKNVTWAKGIRMDITSSLQCTPLCPFLNSVPASYCKKKKKYYTTKIRFSFKINL